ncbi:MAG: tRNA (adenine-N1)-methyltransferase [Meiothermus sp.]|nr:tRNA (adenine-N1)-methyltransferase [Meiothermus sp.]
MNYGDWALLQDRRGRKYLFHLKEGGRFDTQRGTVLHSALLEAGAGGTVTSAQGEAFSVHRPTLEDYLPLMRREATPTYPKDAAAIVAMLDLAPGMRVLEAGSGSGGLTLYLARAVGREGQVWSYELKARHLDRARRNLEAFEDWGNVTWVEGDVGSGGLGAGNFDGAALDLMEPWLVLEAVARALKPDRSLVTYLPNITQAVRLLEEVERLGLPLRHERTLEVIHREWDVRPPVAHPHFQQVGHTAFLTQLRTTAPRASR